MDAIGEAIEFARARAEESPEKYQVAIFTELLRLRLRAPEPQEAGVGMIHGGEPTEGSEGGPAGQVPAHIVSKRGNRKQQAVWAVVRLSAKREEAVNETIRDVIKTELSVSPQTRMDTNRTLKKLTPKYLRREKASAGRGLRYFPTAHSTEIFDGLEE